MISHSNKLFIGSNVRAAVNRSGFTVEVKSSKKPKNPRAIFKKTSTFVTEASRAAIGADDILADKKWGTCIDDAVSSYISQNGLDSKDILWWPVYAYINGKVSYSIRPFTCKINSGIVGFIFESKDILRKQYGVKRISSTISGEVLARIHDEMCLLSRWANNEIYDICLLKDGAVVDSISEIYFDEDAGSTSAAASKLLERYIGSDAVN